MFQKILIAKASGYSNAGTIEFIMDEDHHFYFLEMNTRLQVEHPVTEYVTGLDLVRHQILIAAGEPLRIAQEQVSPRGHAIEVRLYAEDPIRDYLPSTGIIQRLVEACGPGIRMDSGVESDEISQFYDPMLAKLIVSAEDRPIAIAKLFYPRGRMPNNPWTSGGPWRMVGEARALTYRYRDGEHRVALVPLTDAHESSWRVSVDDKAAEVVTCTIEQSCLVLLRRDAEQQSIYMQGERSATLVVLAGQSYRLERRQPPDVESTAHSGQSAQKQQALTAPMAGTIIKVCAQEGDEVQAQQMLVILTAMKMEHAITAPHDGKVKRILAQEGNVVKGGAVIVEMA